MNQPETPMTEETALLDPAGVAIHRDPFGRLQLVLADGRRYENIHPVRAFPLSAPEACTALVNAEGEEIGMLENLDGMDPDSRRALNDALKQAYFITQILTVLYVKSSHGLTTWRLRTDRGDCTIYVKDRKDIRRLTERHIIFTDINGMKFEIPDATTLDERSHAFLESES